MMLWTHCEDHNIDFPTNDGHCPKCNETVGKFMGQDIRFWELKIHPEICKDFRYIDIVKLKPRIEITTHLDWECKYCSSLNPSNLYKCDICGARKCK